MTTPLRSSLPIRRLSVFLPLAGDAVALARSFRADPGRWLTDARPDGDQAWIVPVHAGTLTRPVRVELGASWRSGTTWWRTLSWDPVSSDDPDPGAARGLAERWLPSLDAELGLHLDTSGPATLVLDARYAPPGGALGAAVDAVALQRVAQGTLQRFLRDIAAELLGAAVPSH